MLQGKLFCPPYSKSYHENFGWRRHRTGLFVSQFTTAALLIYSSHTCCVRDYPMILGPFGGEYLSPSLSSCSIDPQGNSSSEDPEDAGVMLPLLSTVRSMTPLLQELNLDSYNVSGFVIRDGNPGFSACILQMPNHEDLRAVIYS